MIHNLCGSSWVFDAVVWPVRGDEKLPRALRVAIIANASPPFALIAAAGQIESLVAKAVGDRLIRYQISAAVGQPRRRWARR
jgi:hypothetical protein